MTDTAGQRRQDVAKQTLTALSYAVEELALGAGAGSVLISLFQDARYFEPHVARYEQLASTGLTVVVAHTGAGPEIAGVHAVRLDPDSPLAAEWAVVLLSPTLAVHVGGHDLQRFDGRAGDLESGRRFEVGWGLDRPGVAAEAARILDALRQDLPPAALAAAATVLVSRLEASHQDLGRTRERLAEESELAVRDPLTGLLNRTGLERWMAAGTTGGAAHPIPATGVVLLDLDGFKRVNDEHGHLVGDELLRNIGATLSDHTRPGDVVCRWGGDEFLVLCPGVTDAELAAVADRLIAAVGATTSGTAEQASVGVSAGVSIVSEAPIPLERVDAALYDAKRAGGGRAVRADA